MAEQFADGAATEFELQQAREQALQLFTEPSELSQSFLPREPHWKMYAFPVEAVGLDDSIIGAMEYVSEATAWSKVGTPEAVSEPEKRAQAVLVRDIFGNPFRPVAFDPAWRTEAVIGIAAGIYDERAFERMPILADALEEAGCEHPDILTHCREPGVHVRGCWVVDLVLGKS